MARGRPSKLTPEVQAKLVEAISDGGYYETACRLAGIEYRTFRNWMRRGENAADDDEYFHFFHAIKRAEAECEQEVVRGWVKVDMVGNWQARATFLERRHPERWSKDRLELKKLTKKQAELEKKLSDLEKR